MRIEVLYVAECPHLPAALAQLNLVLVAEGIQADVRRILVDPNGRDIAEESGELQEHSPSYGLTCRLYPGNKAGAPPLELIRRAVREARQGANS